MVELGSGLSTAVMALAVDALGLDTTIVSLDHDREFAAKTRALLTSLGLGANVDVRYARVEPLPPDAPGLFSGQPWYSLGSLNGIETVDLLFVDGPPAATSDLARYPALPLLRSRLRAGSTIVLDDADRPSELRTLELWLARFPELECTRLPAEKGMARLTLG